MHGVRCGAVRERLRERVVRSVRRWHVVVCVCGFVHAMRYGHVVICVCGLVHAMCYGLVVICDECHERRDMPGAYLPRGLRAIL